MEVRKVNDVVFFGQKPGRALSNMALLMMLRRMGIQNVTGHGFRSTFRDWASDLMVDSSEAAELALAHKVKSKVEAAYRRSDMFEKRRVLMQQWAMYCDQQMDDG